MIKYAQSIDAIPPAPVATTQSIANLCVSVAGCFAAGISAATPRACTAINEQFDHAGGPGEQSRLLHVARTLASRRDQLEMQVNRCVRKRFLAKLECPGDTTSHTGRFSVEALMLFEELGMLEEFELEQAVELLRQRCQAELFVLATQLRKVLACDYLPEARNPLFPRVLLRALQDALAGVGCDASVRRAAFRAYGPLLGAIFADTYALALSKLPAVDHADWHSGHAGRSRLLN